MTPVLLKQMERLTSEWENDFDDVKALSDEMWTDLLKMGAEMRLPRDRLRRQYEEFGGSSQEASYPANSYSYPSAPVAPTYGYGIAKVKCCCAMKNIDYEGEHRNLPVSYKCPVGSQGPPGPIGEPGEDGQAGQPGYNGEDYPQSSSQSSSSRTSGSQYSSGYGGSQGYSDNPYDSYSQPAQEVCEPCPRGIAGNPGPK
ncbi:Collagen triple helix repeat-containing protein [Aphelenchoides bicaudatus]|nr:Collagen triple helix repeat-containing protein [Aphelenchoides bicaudatus]